MLISLVYVTPVPTTYETVVEIVPTFISDSAGAEYVVIPAT